VLTEFRLPESTLYLLYRSRKHLPRKARKFIDLVLESGARSADQVHAASIASVLRYPQRKGSEEIPGKRAEDPLDSLDPYRTRPGERATLGGAVTGAH